MNARRVSITVKLNFTSKDLELSSIIIFRLTMFINDHVITGIFVDLNYFTRAFKCINAFILWYNLKLLGVQLSILIIDN